MSSNKMYPYIEVHSKYCNDKKMRTLKDKIISILETMIRNEYYSLYWNDPEYYDYKYEIYKVDNDELYSLTKASIVGWYRRFFTMDIILRSDNICSWNYEENYVEKYNHTLYSIAHSKLIRLDLWLREVNEVIERLEDILDSFEYDYEDMRIQGKPLYMELTKYVCEPARVERIAGKYNMQWDEYLDAIDL